MEVSFECDDSQKRKSGVEAMTRSKANLFPDLVEQRLIEDIDQPPLIRIKQRLLDRLRWFGIGRRMPR